MQPSDHFHESSPPDQYGPRKGLEVVEVTVCACGMEQRLGGPRTAPRTFVGRTRAMNWRGAR